MHIYMINAPVDPDARAGLGRTRPSGSGSRSCPWLASLPHLAT